MIYNLLNLVYLIFAILSNLFPGHKNEGSDFVINDLVIELDRHDKLLVDALKARGVPESQIVLAYRGHAIPA